ncbi:hypothetical protein [Dyella koreensis]|uniref:ATP-dependent zinc protease domain-containing protein n=1 Tax=Dyella koreensis TaxID=311235 RepID=A0ABW8K947_9GAMM
MKARIICISLLYIFSAQVTGADFCEGSKFTPLDQVLSKPGEFLNQRIQTHAILRTDAKAYTRISLDEKSGFSVLTTADDESTAYNKRHNLSAKPPFNVVSDLFAKLHPVEGAKYKADISKVRYYRQNVMVCGRLVRSMGELRFAVDDMHVEDSYLLPWKNKK